MNIERVWVKNFRLLSDVELDLESSSTLIVGRNNSGKTSLSEVIKRFLNSETPFFPIEDFSLCCHDSFCNALDEHLKKKNPEEVRKLIPAIELKIRGSYKDHKDKMGPAAPFVIDIDPNSYEIIVIVRFALKEGQLENFFEECKQSDLDNADRSELMRKLGEQIKACYSTSVLAVDPNDSSNHKEVDFASLKRLIKTDFICAQRGLDDITSRESNVLAKVLEKLFTNANTELSDKEDQQIARDLRDAVSHIQSGIDSGFIDQLENLMPALESFGYPGLGDQELRTETNLEVTKLLSNFTKVKYVGRNGVALPESYNGLGIRNLIYMLFQIYGFHKSYRSEQVKPSAHLVFIEEPEAHLHPQMQEVFIRKLTELSTNWQKPNDPWSVQFVVSTHSSHIANESGFESIRYFLNYGDTSSDRKAKVKDLRKGLKDTPQKTRNFVHEYLTLTRCDLFFADKAILVEGLSERLILPIVIRKLEEESEITNNLTSQYLTIMEVGGAYAQNFFDLLKFLELPSLVVTDIDSVGGTERRKCTVSKGTATSNSCIKSWFDGDKNLTPKDLISKSQEKKIKEKIRISYQIPEKGQGACGRSFEDAFMLANKEKFKLDNVVEDKLEETALEEAGKLKKSDFALKYSIRDKQWLVPLYISEGLAWLSDFDSKT